jgi:ketosteroid isomerase-like protein
MIMTDSTGKQMNQNFEAVTIWKKQQDGSWKCAVDVLSPLPTQNQ